MKNILILTLFLWSSLSFGVCSNITRSNYGFGTELSSSVLNTDLNTVYSRSNAMPGDCIVDDSIGSDKIEDATIVNADISASAAISHSKIQAPNYALAASDSGSFSTTSTSYVDITNQSVTITTIGRPVLIMIMNGDVTVGGSATPGIGWIKALRGATDLAERNLVNIGATNPQITVPGGSFSWVDQPAAGTYAYKLQAKANGAGITVGVSTAKIFVQEL